MHRRVRDQIESVLAGSKLDGSGERHVEGCPECRDEMAAMGEQAALLRTLSAPEEVEPRAGFYARVIERIEAQAPASIWNLLFDSAFALRVAMASVVFTLLMGIYLVSAERGADRTIVVTSQPDWALSGSVPVADQGPAGIPDRDAVLVNLVTYREQ